MLYQPQKLTEKSYVWEFMCINFKTKLNNIIFNIIYIYQTLKKYQYFYRLILIVCLLWITLSSSDIWTCQVSWWGHFIHHRQWPGTMRHRRHFAMSKYIFQFLSYIRMWIEPWLDKIPRRILQQVRIELARQHSRSACRHWKCNYYVDWATDDPLYLYQIDLKCIDMDICVIGGNTGLINIEMNIFSRGASLE